MAQHNIFILHGWTKDVAKWQPLIDTLQKNNISVKLLKIPGLTSPLEKVWDLNDYVNWLGTQLVGQSQPILLGHSFGGRVAIRYEIKNPNKIKKLILIDSAGIRPMSLAARFKRISFKTLAKIGKTFTQNPGARSLLYQLVREQDYHNADKILAETMAKIVEDDQRPEVGFVKTHTLIIWGGKDKTTPLSDGRLMNKEITGSTLRIIDAAGHSPQYTHPEEVATFILEFLKNSK